MQLAFWSIGLGVLAQPERRTHSRAWSTKFAMAGFPEFHRSPRSGAENELMNGVWRRPVRIWDGDGRQLGEIKPSTSQRRVRTSTKSPAIGIDALPRIAPSPHNTS